MNVVQIGNKASRPVKPYCRFALREIISAPCHCYHCLPNSNQIWLTLIRPTRSSQSAGEEGLSFAVMLFFNKKKVYFSHFCHINYLNIYWTDLHEVCRIGRTSAVDERSEVIFFDPPRDIAMVTNFVGTVYLQYSPYSSHDIR